MTTYQTAPVPAVPYSDTFYISATTVYLSGTLSLTLDETTGSQSNVASVSAGAYTAATFATALASALTTASAAGSNAFTYTVTTLRQGILLPSTSIYGSSFQVNSSGTGTFTIV